MYDYTNTSTSGDFLSNIEFFFYFFIGLLFLALIFLILYKFIKKWEYDKQKIPRSLNMSLLKVSIQRPVNTRGGDDEDARKSVKAVLAKASQFLASLYSIKDNKISLFNYEKGVYLSFEIVSLDEKIVFYLGVPRQLLTLVEKQVYGYYPDSLVEEVERFNIFHEGNYESAAELELSEPSVLPLKTYKEFEDDPLGTITSALSKLEKNEAASVQFIIRPTKTKWQKNAQTYVKLLQEGKGIGNQKISAQDVSKSALKFTGDLAKAAVANPNSGGGDKPKTATPIGEQQMKLINEKIAFVGFETTIRIVVSCPEQAQAKMHLANILSAFTVFNHAIGNQLKKKKKKTEREIIEDFIFRHCPYEGFKNILNTEELASIFHFPNRFTETPNIVWLKSKTAPVPPEVPKEGLFMGYNIHQGIKTPVFMKEKDRFRHTYWIGKTGAGKSTIMKEMIIQDIKNGNGVCYIDPHGTDVTEILRRIPKERMEDVIYFNPADIERPIGLNLLEYDPANPLEKTAVVNELMNVFDFLYNLRETGGPMFEQYFRNAAMLIMEDPESGSTMLEIPKVLADDEFRRFKLTRCKNPVIKNYWEKEAEKAGGDAALANVVPYVTSKMTQFLANDLMRPIIAQQNSAFNFREVMDNKKILLVNLSKGQIGEMNMQLLGLILVGKLFIATMARSGASNINDLPPFYLYIDEFQNFATETIASILSEARKYKLALNITHQFIGQLDKIELVRKAIFGNVGTKLVFRIDVEDAEVFEKSFSPVFNVYDMINLDEANGYISLLSDGVGLRPFSLNTRIDMDRVREEVKQNEQRAQAIITYSRIKYGDDRERIEKDIARRA